jgi:hypothetical protein
MFSFRKDKLICQKINQILRQIKKIININKTKQIFFIKHQQQLTHKGGYLLLIKKNNKNIFLKIINKWNKIKRLYCNIEWKGVRL